MPPRKYLTRGHTSSETPAPKGISVQISIKVQRTLRRNIEDDEGRVHTLWIKDVLYVPKSLLLVLFTQHWSHQANNSLPTQRDY